MDGSGAYFASRTELLDWLNNVLPEPASHQLQLKKIEKCGSGIPYAILLAEIYPHMRNIISRRLKGASAGILSMIATGNPNDASFGIQGAVTEYDSHHNMKLVQDILTKNHISRNVEVDRIAKGHFPSNLEFLQWFKKFSSDFGIQVQPVGGSKAGYNDELDVSAHGPLHNSNNNFLDDNFQTHNTNNTTSPRDSSHGASTTRSNGTTSASVTPVATTLRNARDTVRVKESTPIATTRTSSNSKQKNSVAGATSPAATTRSARAVSPRNDVTPKKTVTRTSSQQALVGISGAPVQRTPSARRMEQLAGGPSNVNDNFYFHSDLDSSGVGGGSTSARATGTGTGFRQSGNSTRTSMNAVADKTSPFVRTAAPTNLTSSPLLHTNNPNNVLSMSPRTRSALTAAELRQIKSGQMHPVSAPPPKVALMNNNNNNNGSSSAQQQATEADYSGLSEPTLQHLICQSQSQLKEAECDRDFFYDKLRIIEALVNKETSALARPQDAQQLQGSHHEQHQTATLLLLESIREILLSADNEI
eukprot:GILI01011087.1.p1 GENE.GILI01011087.1~~GILI01011087.1.p1  ORF type:complete len:532 (+),score=96.84 GILI01011087.1:56-1651(+)